MMCKVASPLGNCLFFKVSIGVKALRDYRIKSNGSQLCASGISAVECCPRKYKPQVWPLSLRSSPSITSFYPAEDRRTADDSFDTAEQSRIFL